MNGIKHMDGNFQSNKKEHEWNKTHGWKFQSNKKDMNGIKHMNGKSIELIDHEWNKTHGWRISIE